MEANPEVATSNVRFRGLAASPPLTSFNSGHRKESTSLASILSLLVLFFASKSASFEIRCRVTKEVRRRRDDDKFFVRRRRECSLLVLTLDQLNGRYTNKALLMVVFACARALLSLKLQNWIFYKYLHRTTKPRKFLASAQRTKKSKSQK